MTTAIYNRKKWQKTRAEDDYTIYKKERNAFCDQIRKARRECWNNFLERATGDDLWTVIRYTRGRRITTLPTLVTPSGDIAESEFEKAAALASISFPGAEGY